MKTFKILIVEDEILIADNIKLHLERKGYEVVGIAISYEEAIALYTQYRPDLTLLDIRLNGRKSGIEVAQFIRDQEQPKPFIFLTSQIDKKNIDDAKVTFPAGYLSKPIQKESLIASIEIAIHKGSLDEKVETISFYDGEKRYIIPIQNIHYIQSVHVYVEIFIKDRSPILQRTSLKNLLEELPPDKFIQTHRSFIVNLEQVTSYSNESIMIEESQIPISRNMRKQVLAVLSN